MSIETQINSTSLIPCLLMMEAMFPCLSLSGVRTTEMVISEVGSPSDTCIKSSKLSSPCDGKANALKRGPPHPISCLSPSGNEICPRNRTKVNWFNSFLIRRTFRSYKAPGFTMTCHTCVECSLWSHSTHYPVPSSFCLHIRQSSTISHALSLPPKFIYEGKGA